MSGKSSSRVVPRPDFPRDLGPLGRAPKYPIRDLLRTLDRPKDAVAIPYNGAKPASVVSALTKLAARRGLRFRHRRGADELLGWVERRATARRRRKGRAA